MMKDKNAKPRKSSSEVKTAPEGRKKRVAVLLICIFVVLIAAVAVLIAVRRGGDGSFFGLIRKLGMAAEAKYDSFSSYEGDPSMRIDGKLDEEKWQGKKIFKNTYAGNISGTLPVLEVTAFPTKYGVYVGSTVSDSNLVNNGQRTKKYNSCWQLGIAAFDADEEPVDDMLYRQRFEIDLREDCYGRVSGVDRAVTVKGKINSGETKSATLEAFFPWQILNVDPGKGIPEQIYMRPIYFGVLQGEETTTEMSLAMGGNEARIRDYYIFDADGYTKPDREGAVIGDNKFGYAKSANWDISREADGIVESNCGYEHHRIFFSREFGDNLLVEVTMVPVKSLGHSDPQSGIIFTNAMGTFHAVFLKFGSDGLVPGKGGTKNYRNYQLGKANNNGTNWDYASLSNFDTARKEPADTREGATLTILKSGDRFWYFADGHYLTCERLPFIDGDVFPGFYSLGADVIYRNYSCKTLTEEEIDSYLMSKGVCDIDIDVDGGGGEATSSAFAVRAGEGVDLTVVSNSGYRLSSLIINGASRLADARAHGVGGVYRIQNVTSHQKILVGFSPAEGGTLNGTVTDGSKPVAADTVITAAFDNMLRYEPTADAKGVFTLKAPAGVYDVSITARGYMGFQSRESISGNVSRTYRLSPSQFGQTVKASLGDVVSAFESWDLTREASRKVSTAYPEVRKPLYFPEAATDFVAKATIAYTTDFLPGMSYQPDLFGGFIFNDGKNNGYISVNNTGFVYSGWKRIYNLFDARLMAPNPKPVTLTAVKRGGQLYMYVDEKPVRQFSFSEVAPGLGVDRRYAVGLYYFADKASDVEFCDYSFSAGSAAADKYIAAHRASTIPLAANGMYADSVLINGSMISSSLSNWDLGEIASNVAKSSYALGCKYKPLYLTATGSTALLSAKIEYTTEFTGKKEDYQPDLFAGFMLNNGTDSGYVTAHNKGLTLTGWVYDDTILREPVLTYPDKRPVTFTVAVTDRYIYTYFDGVFGKKIPITDVVKSAKKGDEFAYGLYILTDKTSDIRFSEVSIATDRASVDGYIKSHAASPASRPVLYKVQKPLTSSGKFRIMYPSGGSYPAGLRRRFSDKERGDGYVKAAGVYGGTSDAQGRVAFSHYQK